MNRFEAKGSFVVVMGLYPAREISPGLGTSEDLRRLPAGFNGSVWTNNLALISGYRSASPPSGP